MASWIETANGSGSGNASGPVLYTHPGDLFENWSLQTIRLTCVRDLVEEVLRHWPGMWEQTHQEKHLKEAPLLSLAIDKARDQMIDIENLSDLELDDLQASYEKIKADCAEDPNNPVCKP